MPIKVLSKQVAERIAAGEVIERPASVVKELVENSIDAGARRIEVELEAGGTKLIRVVDDGCGMDEDDVALAFVGHATSKLSSEDDLFNITTLGFRGEALPSVGAVSTARITSRTHESNEGHEIAMESGVLGTVQACGAPAGTQVEVRNLFQNVPARRKFLKSTATEMAHLSEAITRQALAFPAIHFTLTHNGRNVFNLPPAQDRKQRIGEFFGREIAEAIIPFVEQTPTFEIEGYLLPPTIDRASTTMQYTYVNSRYVRNRSLSHAVMEGYSGMMLPGRRPVCFVFIRVDPAAVDVNVHPTKIEIKFSAPGEVHDRLLGTVRKTLRQERVTPQVSIPAGRRPGDPEAAQQQASVQQAISDFIDGKRERTPTSFPSELPASRGAPAARLPTAGPPGAGAYYGGCMQLLDSYIIEEAQDGLNIIDQHALHERILFERMEQQLAQSSLDSQQLLVPELVELPKQEFYALLDLKEELAGFGLAMEAFGDSTIIVRSFPQMLGRFDAKGFFRDLLDELEGPEGARKVDGRLEKILKMMACKAAVKAGERLSPEQIKNLLQRRGACENAGTCPHGRPTTIFLSRKELEKQFKRT